MIVLAESLTKRAALLSVKGRDMNNALPLEEDSIVPRHTFVEVASIL